MRVVSGVILGYLLFGLSGFALFRVTHHNPHMPASISFKVGSILYGLLFALLAGYVASFLGGRRDMLAARLVAGLVALGAVVSMVVDGISWFPMAALVFMAPAAWVGGRSYVLGASAKANKRNGE